MQRKQGKKAGLCGDHYGILTGAGSGVKRRHRFRKLHSPSFVILSEAKDPYSLQTERRE